MGPTLLLDKSAFQALTGREMHRLTNYFEWNRVDILLWEILSDLSKETKTISFRNEVSILADKFPLIDSVQNVNYIELCMANLCGKNVMMDGRPLVTPTSISTLDDGQVGALFDETAFCKMIYRWQKGDFGKQDEVRAILWKGIKDNLKADDCLQLMQANYIILPASTSINELEIEISNLLRNPRVVSVFLDMFLSYEGVNNAIKRKIRQRLTRCPYSLSKFAPYAFYCLKVFVLFLGAYKFNLLLEKKADDQIDLEYLFYLPFCQVFSSNDKFHMTLAPPLMKKDQVFLSGQDLKKGIQQIESLQPHKETMNEIYVPFPPIPKESIIREIWLKTRWPDH
jgi:hypothetical protein